MRCAVLFERDGKIEEAKQIYNKLAEEGVNEAAFAYERLKNKQ